MITRSEKGAPQGDPPPLELRRISAANPGGERRPYSPILSLPLPPSSSPSSSPSVPFPSLSPSLSTMLEDTLPSRMRSLSADLPTWQDAPIDPPPPKVNLDSEDEVDQLDEDAANASLNRAAVLSGFVANGVGKTADVSGDDQTSRPRSDSLDNQPTKQVVRCVRCEKSNSECIAGPRVSCARCRSMHQSCSLVGRADAEGKMEDEILKLAGHHDPKMAQQRKRPKNGPVVYSIADSRAAAEKRATLEALQTQNQQQQQQLQQQQPSFRNNSLLPSSRKTISNEDDLPYPPSQHVASISAAAANSSSPRSSSGGGGGNNTGGLTRSRANSLDDSSTNSQESNEYFNDMGSKDVSTSTNPTSTSTVGERDISLIMSDVNVAGGGGVGPGPGGGARKRQKLHHHHYRHSHHHRGGGGSGGGMSMMMKSGLSGEQRLLSALRKSNQAAKLYSEAVEELTAYIEEQH